MIDMPEMLKGIRASELREWALAELAEAETEKQVIRGVGYALLYLADVVRKAVCNRNGVNAVQIRLEK